MSIRYWLEQEFYEVRETSDHKDYRVNCPFCPKADRGFHLYVSSIKSVAHCFRCHWAGTHLQLIIDYSGAESFAEAKKLLQKPRNRVSDFETVAQILSKRSKQKEFLQLEEMPEWFTPFKAVKKLNRFHYQVLKYSLERLTIGELIKYNIGYCKDSEDEAFTRMIIPVERGYYQARTIGKGKPKYLNPKFPVGDRLFNYNALELPHVFICEGAISAIAIGSSAVATLGNQGANAPQRERLKYSGVEHFTIAYDAGEETKEPVLELADCLSKEGKMVTIRKYYDGDPDSSSLYTEEDYTFKYKVFGLFNNFGHRNFTFAG